ncbi:MATE family efflux transporter [Fusobacterium sp.]|uniref:MATE family efflux transporter n=1 Tax=Fusobacterium sp. TaxID=68766 RepID=UPI00260D9552|nr:MATE family efflux transporter [Fusobacterium sp.]
MGLSLIVIVTIVIFRTSIISLFTKNKQVIEIALAVFPIMIFLEVGRVLNILLVNSLHAAGDIKYPMILGISSIFLVAVPFSNILGVKLEIGLVGIWIANALDEWCRGIGVLIRWKSKKWQDKRLV